MTNNLPTKRTIHTQASWDLALLLVIISIVEVSAWWSYVIERTSIWTICILHLVCCTALVFLQVWKKRRGYARTYSELALLFVLILGPIGATGILVTLGLNRFYRIRSTPFEQWYKEVVPQLVTTNDDKAMEYFILMGKESAQHFLDPVPFSDLLASEDQSVKRTLLALMLRHFHPSFAPFFLTALNDPDNAIRVLAASAITRIEENFLAENLVLEKRRLSHPGDLDSLNKLAKHYDDRATAGINDAETLERYRERARSLYQELLEMRPLDTSLQWLLGRLLLRSKKVEEAATVFNRALELESYTGETTDPIQRVWYWECLYEQSRYAELRKEINAHHKEVPKDSTLPHTIKHSIDYWAESDQKVLAV